MNYPVSIMALLWTRLILCVLILETQISCLHSSVADWNEESKLRDALFLKQNIDKHSRPIQYYNGSIEVDMDLLIQHIVQLDEKTEVLTLNAWIFHAWQDLHFRWLPDQFGGLYYLPVHTTEIWIPDVYLLNSANAAKTQPVTNVSALITPRGYVYWFSPTTLQSICSLDLRNFPFDDHVCILQFASWTYWGDQLNLIMTFENMSLTPVLFDEHNEWEIVHSFGNRNIVYYGSYPYIMAEFHVHLQRRAPYYHLAVITPMLIALLVTLVIFWIPPTVEEKFVIGGVSEVILSLVLAQLYWIVPRSGSNIPGLVLLCGNAMFFSGLSIVIALIVTIYSRYKFSTPPSFVKNIVYGWRRQILCLPEGEQKLSSNAQLLTNEDGTDEAISTDDTRENSFDWYLLGITIDRISFFLYSLIFCILLVVTFS